MMVPATSLTHQHLLSVLVTEADRFPSGSVVRVLDAGCGDGVLMDYLTRNLREGHVKLPLAHRIPTHVLVRNYIRLLGPLGAKYRDQHRQSGISVKDYAWAHADYLRDCTNYLSCREVLDGARAHSLYGSFR